MCFDREVKEERDLFFNAIIIVNTYSYRREEIKLLAIGAHIRPHGHFKGEIFQRRTTCYKVMLCHRIIYKTIFIKL